MAIIRNAIIVAVIVVAASSLYMLIYLNSAPNNKDKSVNALHLGDFILNGGHLEKKAAAFFYKLAADGGNKEALFKFCDVLEDPNEYTYSRAIEFCQTHRKAKNIMEEAMSENTKL